MVHEVTMPKYGQTMEEGTIVEWMKRIGDSVEKGDTLVRIESDKTTLDVEAEFSGFLVAVKAREGDVVLCGNVIAYIGNKGEQV